MLFISEAGTRLNIVMALPMVASEKLPTVRADKNWNKEYDSLDELAGSGT